MGGGRELDAAGIGDPALRRSYAECRRLNASHGRTYYLATLLLPPAKRPAVHALYGFARYADELVDDLANPLEPAEASRRLDQLERALDQPEAGEPAVLQAFRHTERTYLIPRAHTTAFLASMRMDLAVTRYDTHDELDRYMAGSAVAIGLQMLPVLGHAQPQEVVAPYATDLGLAFQLTNFVRDVAEDRRRGRVYVPDPRGAARRARALYRSAAPGIRLLDPTSRDCVATAATLYERILDETLRAGFPDHRVTVGRGRRAAVALPRLAHAVRVRRASPSPSPVNVRRADPTTPTSTTSG